MKTLLLIAGACIVGSSAFAQGIIVFNNNPVTLGGSGAPIIDTATGNRISGTEARAALIAGPKATAVPASLAGAGNLEMGAYTASPFQTWVNFRTGTSTASGAGFVSVGSQSSRSFASFGFDAQATAQMVVWTGNYDTWSAAYAAAIAPGSTVKIGWSAPIDITTASSGSATTQPKLMGMAGFGVQVVPEPATASLIGLGLASLLIFRRRK